MTIDVIDLRDFYSQRLGIVARRLINRGIHARWRNWNLRQLPVRGREKVRAVVTLYALTNNLLQGYRLLQQRMLAEKRAQEGQLAPA